MDDCVQVLVPGPLMRDLLRHHGALEEDLAALESGEVHAAVSPDPAPVMTHRQVQRSNRTLVMKLFPSQIAFHRMLLGPGGLVTPAGTHAVTQVTHRTRPRQTLDYFFS